MKNKQYDHLFKFVMIGNSAVGKSSLLFRFSDDQFNQNYMATIGVDFRFKTMKLSQKIIKLQIWDTAGQQRFRTIVNTYYKNTQAVFLIFDLTSKQSFNDIKNYWINQVQSYTDQKVQLILVGNKADCQNREVPAQDIKNLVEEKKMHYFETSAKTGTNVHQMFSSIADSLLQKGIQGKSSNKTNDKIGKLQNINQKNTKNINQCSC